MVKPLVFVLLFFTGQALASEPDYAREARLADEIVDVILDGDPVWLASGEREFLSIYTEADEPGTAVVILHGRGFHPDWSDTINPLRLGLVERGYSTLSLQMPVLEKVLAGDDSQAYHRYGKPQCNQQQRLPLSQSHQAQ